MEGMLDSRSDEYEAWAKRAAADFWTFLTALALGDVNGALKVGEDIQRDSI